MVGHKRVVPKPKNKVPVPSTPDQGRPSSPMNPSDVTRENSAYSPIENSDAPTESSTLDRKRKWSSPVWDDYDTHDGDEYEDNIPRAFCKYCKGGPIIARSSSGTSNFTRHTEKCHARVNLDIGQMMVTKSGLLARKIDNSVYKEMVSLAIIRHGYPFTYAEHEGNRNVHLYLNSDCKPISRNTAKNHVMKIHEREQKRLIEFMRRVPGKICLTCDMWTSIVDQGYLSLTAHFVDAEWKLHDKILNFCHVPPPHSAVALHDKVFALLKDWGIHKKVSTITLDNAKCNDNMQDLLADSLSMHAPLPCDGEYFHVRCAAHILNLIVQDGLKVIKDGLSKVRSLVNYVFASERRTLIFRENAVAAGVDCSQNLCLDCTTRWNSTYKMLVRTLKYRPAFSNMRRLERIDPKCPVPPSDEEWSTMQKISALLKPFDDITTLISGRKYSTANLYLRCVWKIESLLLEYVASEEADLREMAKRMKEKFDKYWASYSLILSFAAMLDPRYKFEIVEYCFHELDATSSADKAKHVRDQFFRLFNEYEKQSRSETSHSNQNRSEDDDFDGFSTFGVNQAGRCQLDMYLNEYKLNHREYHDLDILKWWKENQNRFPIVAEMARDLLAIPITTVASESAFSMGSRVVSKWRSSLHPQTANALLTTRSWIFGFEEGDEDNQEMEGLEFELEGLSVDEGTDNGAEDI